MSDVIESISRRQAKKNVSGSFGIFFFPSLSLFPRVQGAKHRLKPSQTQANASRDTDHETQPGKPACLSTWRSEQAWRAEELWSMETTKRCSCSLVVPTKAGMCACPVTPGFCDCSGVHWHSDGQPGYWNQSKQPSVARETTVSANQTSIACNRFTRPSITRSYHLHTEQPKRYLKLKRSDDILKTRLATKMPGRPSLARSPPSRGLAFVPIMARQLLSFQ